MAGISRATALEIFTNPTDLEFTISQEEGGRKFAVGIYRGPGHNYKPMLTSEPFAKTLDEAVETVKVILEAIVKTETEGLNDQRSLVTQILNPDNRPVDQSKVLNAELIARIVDELRLHKKASTWEMVPAH